MSRAPTPPLAALSEAEYEAQARAELAAWLRAQRKGPSRLAQAAWGLQERLNRLIPEKLQAAVSAVIEKMTRAIVAGADLATPTSRAAGPLSAREAEVRKRIAAYRAAAALEGGVTGAGGFMLGLADFPALIAAKIKLLFDIAALYGHDGGVLDERLFILSVFQLAFSGADHRRQVLAAMDDWDARVAARPKSLDAVDWRRLQQEYRDYIDLAKMAQMIPVIGAPVGALVNFHLLDRLGETAVQAYRMRWFARGGPPLEGLRPRKNRRSIGRSR